MITIAIDPGSTGGIAIFNGKKLLEIFSMPALTHVKSSGGNKQLTNAAGVANILRSYVAACPGEVRAVMELVNSSPQMGVVSAFSFGEAKGTIIGVLGALEIPYTEVMPQVWKAVAGVKVPNSSTMKVSEARAIGKELSRSKAIKAFPEFEPQLRLKKDADKADAIWIGWYKVTTDPI